MAVGNLAPSQDLRTARPQDAGHILGALALAQSAVCREDQRGLRLHLAAVLDLPALALMSCTSGCRTGLKTMHSALPWLAAAILSLPAVGQNVGLSLSNLVQGYVDVPYDPALVPQSGITVEAWITYDESTIPGGWRFPTVLRQGHSTGGSENYFLRVEAGNSNARSLRWVVVTSSGAAIVVNWPFGAGRLLAWTHVAATYNGSQAILYIDGVQVAAANGNGLPLRNLNNESLRIGTGSDIGAPMEVWNGEIDEVRLWPFARTAGEIAATRNLHLDSIPGRVSTWNFDNHALDTSGGLHGSLHGGVAFVANSLSLPSPAVPPVFSFGNGTAGCLGSLAATISTIPVAGNANFAAVATRFPANGAGFAAIAFGAAPAPLSIAGIDYWLDPASSVLQFVTASSLGVMRLPLGLPAWVAPGSTFGFQFAGLDPCGPQGITASQAIVVLTQ